MNITANLTDRLAESERKHRAVIMDCVRLRDLLRRLYDLQNGSPLPKYREAWLEVMREIEDELGIEEIQQ
jgi:hypothetical protein